MDAWTVYADLPGEKEQAYSDRVCYMLLHVETEVYDLLGTINQHYLEK